MADRSMVPEWYTEMSHRLQSGAQYPWYAGMLHRLQTGVQYPVGTQECYTNSEQVVRRKVKV